MRLVELSTSCSIGWRPTTGSRFTLDGQVATVDDYLEVRPEAEPRIERLIAEGRLAIGPWQILMDEFLVSGETIVRNLEIGWHAPRRSAGRCRVGYLPDMFGHIAQMPQILRRAGIDRRRRLARRPRGDRPPCLHLARARRLDRPRPSTSSAATATARTCLRCPGPPRPTSSARYRRGQPRVLRRPLDPRDVRDRPRGPLADARRPSSSASTPAATTSRSGSRR